MNGALLNSTFGRDDGVICDSEVTINGSLGKRPRKCGGNTFLVDDQGHGYCVYECEKCGTTFGVQYDSADDE